MAVWREGTIGRRNGDAVVDDDNDGSDGDLAKMGRDWARGGGIEEREEEAVVSQETHPKVDHQPKAARTRCQHWWHRHRHYQT